MKNDDEIIIYVDPALKDLIPKFIAKQIVHLEEAKLALQSSSFADLQSLGHKMKGSCGGYGFSILGDLGAEIEKLAETCNAELLSQSIKQLEKYLSRLRIEYREK